MYCCLIPKDGHGTREKKSPLCDSTGLRESYSLSRGEREAICERQVWDHVSDGCAIIPASVGGGLHIKLSNGILLADVQEMCLRWEQGTPRYLTLSYIWGSAPFFHLNTGNYEELQKQYFLLNAPFPQTFRDAIHLTWLDTW
jgi:hypothetical protein